MPGGSGNLGAVPPLKCIRLYEQQTPQQYGAADLSAGDSASRPMSGFGMVSPAAGVTSAGAMRILSAKFFDHMFFIKASRFGYQIIPSLLCTTTTNITKCSYAKRA